jgi:hypothetical protein
MKTFWISILLSILLFLSCSKMGGDEEFYEIVYNDIDETSSFLSKSNEEYLYELKKRADYDFIYELYKSCFSNDSLIKIINSDIGKMNSFLGITDILEERKVVNPFENEKVKMLISDGDAIKCFSAKLLEIEALFGERIEQKPRIKHDSFSSEYLKDCFKEYSNVEAMLKLQTLKQNIHAQNFRITYNFISSYSFSDGVFMDVRPFIVNDNCVRKGEYLHGQVLWGELFNTMVKTEAYVDGKRFISKDGIIEIESNASHKGVNRKVGFGAIYFNAKYGEMPECERDGTPFMFDFYVK